MQGVILAAGKGKRLQPLTQTRSKAMAPVAGKPLVGRVVETLTANGVDDLIVVVGPDDQAIRGYFGDGRAAGLRVRFVVQGERLGMAHALGLAAPHLSGPFVLSACDNLVAAEHVGNLIATQAQHAAAAVLSLMPIPIEQAPRTGVVVWEPPYVRRIVEKPQPADAPSNISSLPLYVFDRRVLEVLPRVQPSPRGEYELQDAIQMLIDVTGAVMGVITPERRQVTDVADLLSLSLAYLAQTPELRSVASAVPASVTLCPPVVIEAGVAMGPGCTIGPRVYLERGVSVGAGARLSDVVALGGAHVPPGVSLSHRLVAADLPVTI